MSKWATQKAAMLHYKMHTHGVTHSEYLKDKAEIEEALDSALEEVLESAFVVAHQAGYSREGFIRRVRERLEGK